MKKYFFAWAILLGCVFSFASCQEKIKETQGVVTSVDGSQYGDTIRSMKMLADGDTLVFTLKDARFDNGVMLKGDRVKVHYISGNGDTLRALLVYVKPNPSKVIEIKQDTTKQLLSR